MLPKKSLKNVQVNFRMTAEDRAELQRMADQEHVTIQTVLERAIFGQEKPGERARRLAARAAEEQQLPVSAA